MQEQPIPAEILATVSSFLRNTAVPRLDGHASFMARVAANAVDLVRRDLELRPASDDAESQRLGGLLGHGGSLEALNAELAERIRDDRIGVDSPELLEHLWQTTLAKVAIDQPNYASYRAALQWTDVASSSTAAANGDEESTA